MCACVIDLTFCYCLNHLLAALGQFCRSSLQMGKPLQLGLVHAHTHTRRYLSEAHTHLQEHNSLIGHYVHSATAWTHNHIIVQCHTALHIQDHVCCHGLHQYITPSEASCYTHVHTWPRAVYGQLYISVHIMQHCPYHNRHRRTLPRAIYDMIYACA